MNQNAYEVFIYMIIHFFIFLFKKILWKFLSKIFSICCSKDRKEVESMRKKLDSLNEVIREISPAQEFSKYTTKEREINNLKSQIIEKEKNGFNNESDSSSNNKNSLKKIFSFLFKFPMIFVLFVEYLVLKNKYLEVIYKNNKNNIVANHYYNESDNKVFVLIPVYRILIYETLALNSIFNLIKKLSQ